MMKKIVKNYIYLMYPLATLIYTLYLFFSWVRTGIYLTAVLALGFVGICCLGYITVKTTEDKIFTAYFVYNLLSGIWCVFYGIPVGVFIGEVSTTALPMVLYYAGRGFDDDEAEKYYGGFLAASLFMGLFGAVLYIWAPQFYLDFSYENEFISLADAATARVRMNSLLGSGPTAVYLTYAVCASAFFMRKKDRKSRTAGTILLILSILLAFMANQRSSMFSIIMMLIFFNFVDYAVDKDKPKKLLWIELSAIAALLLGIFIFARGVFEKFYIRLASIPSGFGERSESWVAAVNNMNNMWLGDGLGSRGHRAMEYQRYIVADGGLVKLYTEMGLIGTSLIIFLLVLIFKKSVRHVGKIVPELAVIVCTILMSIGSNVLEMELCAPIVYFALGRAVKKITEEPDPVPAEAEEKTV